MPSYFHSSRAAVAEWYRHQIVAGFVTSSSPVPLKTRRVGQRCTLNLSRAECPPAGVGVLSAWNSEVSSVGASAPQGSWGYLRTQCAARVWMHEDPVLWTFGWERLRIPGESHSLLVSS
ncbi:hypothetical protein TNCV_5070321 [Trichonephila clavipes]|nr:hypothetical protein TNCV_5070321 [Trichonephila clavipes]